MSDVKRVQMPGVVSARTFVASEDYDALAAELAQVKQDAERYRWARDKRAFKTRVARTAWNAGPSAVDAAIDAAIAPPRSDAAPGPG